MLGEFSIADCMYYPVATRYRTYGVPLPDYATYYSQRLFERPHHVELEAIAKDTPPIAEYDAKLAG